MGRRESAASASKGATDSSFPRPIQRPLPRNADTHPARPDPPRRTSMAHGYTYQDTLATSEKITWRIEDIIGGAKSLDFKKPFMPEALARTAPLGFLSPAEQKTLN